jgi:hypothetical protein
MSAGIISAGLVGILALVVLFPFYYPIYFFSAFFEKEEIRYKKYGGV